ncbi:MAG TPA: helix-turn-helix domain-containing protein, partial [Miltoncostaeales bacterium]|nr:helix-turn-helix domain-containing protein [Miltoncostaeales bacterium]
MNLGDILREARLRRGLEIADCESATKIRGKYLRALEEEQFDVMPGQTFVRGFLKTYSDVLGLDGLAMVDAYEAQYQRPRETTAFEEVLRRSRMRRRSRESRLLIVVTVLALAVSTAIWGVFDGSASATDAKMQNIVFATSGRQPTYVEARERTSDGRLLFTPGNLNPDAPITVDAQLPLFVHVGDGPGLALSVDGTAVTIPAAPSDVTVL